MHTSYDNDRRRSMGVWAGALVVMLIVGWVFVRPAISDDNASPAPQVASSRSTTVPSTSVASGPPVVSVDDTSAGATPTTEAAADGDDVAATGDAADGASEGSSDDTVTVAATTPAEARPDTEVSVADTASVPEGPAAGATYDTLPDGSPAPILAIYDTETITLTGAVPSETAKSRLETLAVANSRFPDAVLVSLLTIDETVPRTIGVRVVEKTSARFRDGAAEVYPEHAAELDRLVAFLGALDHVTMLVIGHADQRGDARTNYELSERRAQAVVRYFVEQGIDPSRMSSRAVGEEDLLTLNDDATALALNRRTEFVLYGIFADPAADQVASATTD